MVSEDFLLRKFKDEETELIKLTEDLVKIPSVNPPGDMSDIVDFLREYFDLYGLSYELYEPIKGVITMYLKAGEPEPDDFIHLNGHVDVVPVGDEAKWDVDPFSGKIIDGYMYGRGSSDMKSGVAVAIKVFDILARYWEGLPRRLGLMIVPDEETGSRYSVLHFIKSVGLRPRYVLIGEPSTVDRLEIGEKGIYEYVVRVFGEPAHASLSPYVGDNAIMKVFKLVSELYKITEETIEPPSELREVVDLSGRNVAEFFKNPELSRLYKSVTCNVGVIKGGDKVNVVAPWAEVEVDMRIPHGLVMDDVRDMVRKRLDKYKGFYEIRGEMGHDPTVTNPDSNLVRSMLKAGKKILGHRPDLHLVAGATDCRHFRDVGSEAVIYGPGDPSKIHSYNERVLVDDIRLCGRIWLSATYNLIMGSH